MSDASGKYSGWVGGPPAFSIFFFRFNLLILHGLHPFLRYATHFMLFCYLTFIVGLTGSLKSDPDSLLA